MNNPKPMRLLATVINTAHCETVGSACLLYHFSSYQAASLSKYAADAISDYQQYATQRQYYMTLTKARSGIINARQNLAHSATCTTAIVGSGRLKRGTNTVKPQRLPHELMYRRHQQYVHAHHLHCPISSTQR